MTRRKPQKQQIETRWKVVLLREQGCGYKLIKSKTGADKKFVKKWEKVYAETGTVARKTGSGAPTKCSQAVVSFIRRVMRGKRRRSCRKMAARLKSDKGIDISHQSIANYARKEKIKPYRRQLVPLLSDREKEKRINWVQAKINNRFPWKRCVFTDESPFELYPRGNPHNDVVWANNSAEVPPIPRVTHSPSIMVWGGVSVYGKTKLWIFNSTEKAPDYQRVLKSCLLPATKKWFQKQKWHLVEDRAKPHTAKSTREWMKKRKINSILLPAKSPDINIIEKVWSVMKDEVYGQELNSMKQLKAATRKAWRNIGIDFIRTLYDRIPTVLSTIVNRSGSATE